MFQNPKTPHISKWIWANEIYKILTVLRDHATLKSYRDETIFSGADTKQKVEKILDEIPRILASLWQSYTLNASQVPFLYFLTSQHLTFFQIIGISVYLAYINCCHKILA